MCYNVDVCILRERHIHAIILNYYESLLTTLHKHWGSVCNLHIYTNVKPLFNKNIVSR